jgi:hypothetical protein
LGLKRYVTFIAPGLGCPAYVIARSNPACIFRSRKFLRLKALVFNIMFYDRSPIELFQSVSRALTVSLYGTEAPVLIANKNAGKKLKINLCNFLPANY